MLLEVEPDPDDPAYLFIFSRMRGDLERFAPSVTIHRRLFGDRPYTAAIPTDEFFRRLTEHVANLRPGGLVENVSPRDPRRAALYQELTRLCADRLGAFGMPGSMVDIPTQYDDDPDVDDFLKG